MTEFKRENVFVSEEQLKQLKDLYSISREPIFGMTSKMAFRQAERVDKAHMDFRDLLNKIAVERGLPEPEKDKDGDPNNYGLDFQNGEILSRELTPEEKGDAA